MPHLSESNRKDIEKLKERYRSLSWYAKLFFPSKVSAALLCYQSGSDDETIQAMALCKVLLNETWSIQQWFFSFFNSCLDEFSRSWLIRAVRILNETGLLAGYAAQANFNAVASHQNPYEVVGALWRLNGAGLLTGDGAQANFNAVVGHQYPSDVADALRTVNDAGLLIGDAAQSNRDALAGHQSLCMISNALWRLNDAGLLTGDAAQANFNAVAGQQNPYKVVEALCALEELGLLTGDGAQANFNAVAGHQEPSSVARALSWLHAKGLLTGDGAQANRDAVAGHQEPSSVAHALSQLHAEGLLTGDAAQANRDAVAGHHNPSSVADAFDILNEAGLQAGNAAQANFNILMRHSAILLHAVMWQRIPGHLFTQARFTALIEICQQHADNPAAGRARVIAYINREILGMNEPAAEGPRLNAVQSTHTASVHQTVSESATRLMRRYGTQISGYKLDAKIEELSIWLTAQVDTSIKVVEAKRCLRRLTALDYFFTDPSSQVSTKQLLALFWIAIHDEEHRMGSLDDATSQLVEGLYEIQREYNISETGEDNGADVDIPTCAAGTFNKLIEKGHGLHPDMIVNFISQAGFALKLPCVVREEAMAYLRGLSSAEIGPLIEAIKAEGNSNSVGPIWEAIQASVAARMFDEFGSLFGNGKATPAFVDAIAAGEYLPLSPEHLDQLTSRVMPESGAMAATTPHPDSFFARTPSGTHAAERGESDIHSGPK